MALLSPIVLHLVALPEPVLRAIMLALPVDSRARCAVVCRALRDLLADVALWQELDLSPAGGLAPERVTRALVRGAAARAAGQLRVVDFGACISLPWNDLVTSNRTALRVVRFDRSLRFVDVRWVLAEVPQLEVLELHVDGEPAELIRLLRNEAPFGPLRAIKVEAYQRQSSRAEILALAAALAAHPWTDALTIYGSTNPDPAALNALLDAATVRRLSELAIHDSDLHAENVPSLSRVLLCGTLTKLEFAPEVFPLDETCVAQLWAALLASRKLKHLCFWSPDWTAATHHVFAGLFSAAAALPALTELLVYSYCAVSEQHKATAGQALGALLAANSPSLRRLDVEWCHLGDEGVAPLLEGLAQNTHLRSLECGYNHVTETFERDVLEPAMAALAARADA